MIIDMNKTDIFARFALSFLCRPNIIALVSWIYTSKQLTSNCIVVRALKTVTEEDARKFPMVHGEGKKVQL